MFSLCCPFPSGLQQPLQSSQFAGNYVVVLNSNCRKSNGASDATVLLTACGRGDISIYMFIFQTSYQSWVRIRYVSFKLNGINAMKPRACCQHPDCAGL